MILIECPLCYSRDERSGGTVTFNIDVGYCMGFGTWEPFRRRRCHRRGAHLHYSCKGCEHVWVEGERKDGSVTRTFRSIPGIPTSYPE